MAKAVVPPLIKEAAKQRRKVVRLRDEHQQATDDLARILLDIRDSDDPDTTLSAAAREMGISKQAVNSLLAKAQK